MYFTRKNIDSKFVFLSCLSARIGKNKRKKASDDGQVCPLCNETLSGSVEEMSRHVEACLDQVVDGHVGASISFFFPAHTASEAGLKHLWNAFLLGYEFISVFPDPWQYSLTYSPHTSSNIHHVLPVFLHLSNISSVPPNLCDPS